MIFKLINTFNFDRGKIELYFEHSASPLRNPQHEDEDPLSVDNLEIKEGKPFKIEVKPPVNEYWARFWFPSYANLEISNKGNEWTITETAHGITEMASGSGNVTIGDDNQHPLIYKLKKNLRKIFKWH